MTATVRLAVLGHPLSWTRSPELHRAGARALGLACESRAIPTPPEALAGTLSRLATEGYTGCNLTMPLKEPAFRWVSEASPAATRARSVNTISFREGGAHGDTTDGAGFLDLLASLGRAGAPGRVVLLGAGGAARSLAVALADATTAELGVVSRRAPAPDDVWGGVTWHAWGSAAALEALGRAAVVVNCTPLAGEELPAEPGLLARGTLVVDLNYREALTPWVREARALGLEAVDGLGLLVHQARHSLALWFGRDVPLAPLAAAVGWPR